MGKISEALRKVTQEQERRKESGQVVLKPSADKQQPASEAISQDNAKKKLSLEDKLALKEKLFIAKAKDNSGIDPRVVVYSNYSSPVSEQYRILRTNIKSRLRKIRVSNKLSLNKSVSANCIFTITSSTHSEGKTLSAVNLAVALASDLESRILLIDCDLRNGSVHKLLNVGNKPGLAEMLANGTDGSLNMFPTKLSNLFVMPRGKTPSNPSELLGSRRMRVILEKIKAHPFTYVILDTPPILPFTDASVLGMHTDGVIIVVEAHRTSSQAVRKAKNLLEQAHNKFLGFILTKVEHYTPDFYAYYHYYYSRKNR